MTRIQSHLTALLLLLTAGVVGCGEREQTKIVDGYTVVIAAGGAAFTPKKIASDGKTTTIELQTPYHGRPPTIFTMSGEHDAGTLRYRWDGAGSRFVVNGQLERTVLASKNARVTITRN